jgi:plasmid maintenance system killer protein
MIELAYKPAFLRGMKKLPPALRREALERIDQFRDPANHRQLRVHKLRGALAGYFSFAVNYRYRVVFAWERPGRTAVLFAIGDHAVYE